MFTHLDVTSGYSFKYGTAQPHDLVERAVNFGMHCLALTDQDSIAGAIRFTQACESAGIAPILGINLSYIQKKYRVILMAQEGHLSSLYRLITALHSESSTTGEKVLTYKFLEKNSDLTSKILILHTPTSQLSKAIASRRHEEALSIYQSTRELFADQAIAVVSHMAKGNGPFSTPFAAANLRFARTHGVSAVLTNAVRMLDRSDGPLADVLDSARLLVPLHERHIQRSNSESYFKNEKEMLQIGDEVARMAGDLNSRYLFQSTEQWAERSSLSPRRDVGIGSIHLPEPHLFGAANYAELSHQLRSRCIAGLHRYRPNTQELSQAEMRLEEELSTVHQLGYEPYFLAVADVAEMARDTGIRVAARGSGAGSLINYLLGVSGVEPISHGLLMERFCSVQRGELPDIDIDVESHRRLEVYQMIFDRFGYERTATVAMVDTYRARHAIRDVGAALGIAPMEIDLIAKSLPHIRARNISKALENLPELKGLNLTTPLMKTAIHLAEKLDGLPRHLSMHPCAVLLSDTSLHDVASTEINASGFPMVPFDKDDVEVLGLLKLDVLGVRMQSTLTYAIKEIERVDNTTIALEDVPLNDVPTFDLIKSTRTLGLFQIESPGQRELIGKFAPRDFNDLIVDISLFRPGPVKSDMITPFLNSRHEWKSRKRIHPALDGILDETEGVVVFHEQVIRIISAMTGISLADADERRRQLGTFESQQEVCDWFFPASVAQGFDIAVVDEVWEILRAFASFGFCKAHAAAFALPTYHSAWLKAHYPAAFLAGVLTHDPGMYPRRLIIDEARQMNIDIAPIDINLSDSVYRVEKNEERYAIRISLKDVQGISENEIESIIAGRPYLDLADFVHRGSASQPVTEALILIGAFQALHPGFNHRDLLLHFGDLTRLNSSLQKSSRNKAGTAQMALHLAPSSIEKSGLKDFTSFEKVRHEVAITGMDISHHLMEFYGDFLNAVGAVRSSEVIKQRSDAIILVAGVKVALQTPPVRSSRRVMFLTLDDGYGCNDITFFEDIQAECASLLYGTKLFLVRGAVRRTGAKGVSLRALSAWDLRDSYQQWRNLRNL